MSDTIFGNGCFFFTFGHGIFVVDAMDKLKRTASDIRATVRKGGPVSRQSIVRSLARPVGTTSAIVTSTS